MTYIPPDAKEPLPDYEPPPYAPTDPSLSGGTRSEVGFPSAEVEKGRPASQEQAQPHPNAGGLSTSAPRIPQSGAVKSSSSVTLAGPLEILGPVSSSGSVTLSSGIAINGKIQSSGTVTLSNNVKVGGKINASGSFNANGNVFIDGEVQASGSVDLKDGVVVAGRVEASGSARLVNDVKVQGKIECSGSLVMKDGVIIDEDVNASVDISIEGVNLCVIGGKAKCSKGCTVDGTGIIE